VIYGLAIVVVAVDQILKWVVRHHLALSQGVWVWPPVVELYHIQNAGGAFGILPHFRLLFVVVALIVIGAVVYVDYRYRPTMWTRIGLGLLLGGAVGNFCDRIWQGTVTDYVYIAIIHFPIFNLADVCIDAGVIILLLHSLIAERKPSERDR